MPPGELQAPPLHRRMACWLYESFLLLALAMITALCFSVVMQMRHALQYREWLAACIAVVLGVYCVWCWSRGQTLPMRTWRIGIVDRHGRRLTRGRATLRYVYCSMWFLPPLVVAHAADVQRWRLAAVMGAWILVWALLGQLHPQRQFWHDAWAGTRLVTDDRPR